MKMFFAVAGLLTIGFVGMWFLMRVFAVAFTGIPQEDQIKLDVKRVGYDCGGRGVSVLFVKDSASISVAIKNSSTRQIYLNVPQVVSASGGRYADKDVEFWTKGNAATLSFVETGDKLDCRLVK